jgi:hypothetical protein
VLPEVEKAVEPQKKVYSKDDFFDSLSCDVLDRMSIAPGADGPPPEKPQARITLLHLGFRPQYPMLLRCPLRTLLGPDDL